VLITRLFPGSFPHIKSIPDLSKLFFDLIHHTFRIAYYAFHGFFTQALSQQLLVSQNLFCQTICHTHIKIATKSTPVFLWHAEHGRVYDSALLFSKTAW